ncbi:MAG TPA: hypothetical protein VMX17_00475, partial [Candidatus Glassbacteria bacterium]|nr:hypothetical protein [Candidatus Glassbacteria bacterium]
AQDGAAGTAGPPIQGYAGGNALAIDGENIGGGGGGGSSGVGTTATSGVMQPAGGPGTSDSISGSPVTYAAGGAGANRKRQTSGTNATANTGNGGTAGGADGGNTTGGDGGSGIVIIRYIAPATLNKVMSVALSSYTKLQNVTKATTKKFLGVNL